MVNQVNPWGTVDYKQTGTNRFQDSFGKWVETPTYTQTTNLSPEQQKIFEQSQAAESNLAGLANEQSAKLKDYLNKPFEFNNQDAANWAYDLGAQRLDPRFAQDEDKLRTTLANKGIREGTAAWDTEMARLGQSKNDAYNNLMLTGRGQAFSEALAQRNQPINEITALLSGSQVSNPAQMSGGTPQTSVGGVDYTGLVNQKYQSEMNQYQAKMGGLFGLGSAALGMFKFSDEHLKTDVERVGRTDDGTPIYTYRYKDGGPTQMGVMAQDVEKKQPDAVKMHPSGFRMVDYGKVH
ncbi:tail fiber domain-containing protein [Pseudochrobactrum lubricantis]|uniref:tail fiber domain-containing protein n=1 Tax=Pseudochrobactrum lubricantis TaxID=558172 RepID=UPI0035D71980